MAIIEVVLIKNVIIQAEQFLGQQMEIVQVMGLDPTKLCGCLMIGGPYQLPHFHIPPNKGYVVSPGNWVIRHKQEGKEDVLVAMSNEDFNKLYKQKEA